jgi:hypothetical protein
MAANLRRRPFMAFQEQERHSRVPIDVLGISGAVIGGSRMSQDKAMLREFVERIEGVARTHYELEIEGSSRKKTLVVEVDFDLDPNSSHFSKAKIDSIENAFATIIREENGDAVSKLKILGRSEHATAAGQGASSKVGATTAKSSPSNFQPPSN